MSGKQKTCEAVFAVIFRITDRVSKTGIPAEYLFRFLAGLRNGTDGFSV